MIEGVEPEKESQYAHPKCTECARLVIKIINHFCMLYLCALRNNNGKVLLNLKIRFEMFSLSFKPFL